MAVKLRQGQVWIHGTEFIRVVRLDRLEVAFKIFMKLGSDEGQHHRASKKEFCRMVKNCTLYEPKAAAAVAVVVPGEMGG